MSAEAISTHLGGADVREALKMLAADYAGRGVQLVERGKRWHFQTAPDLAHLLRREREDVRRLSRAATEVLAIVAITSRSAGRKSNRFVASRLPRARSTC